MNSKRKYASILLCLWLTSSCTNTTSLFNPDDPELIDPARNLTRSDYQNLADTVHAGGPLTKTSISNVIEPSVPDLAAILASPKPPKIAQTQLVSLAVTDDVPLKDVLIELARLADVDVEIDAGITGGISFRAKDRPFNEVIDRVADLAGLRYSIKNNIIRIERDTPYVDMYSLDFLNLDRSAESSTNISTSVLSSNDVGGTSGGGGGSGGGTASGNTGSSGGGGGGQGFFNGSTSNVVSKADSDFWKQFEAGIKRILSYKEVTRVSNIAIAAQPESPVPTGAQPVTGSLPGLTSGATTTAASSDGGASFFIINREASTMTIAATEKQHELVSRFLKKINRNASAQVLIEAKIVEISLKDEFRSGIDWNKLGTETVKFTSSFAGVSDTANIATLAVNEQNILGSMDLVGAINLAQAFGVTRTLSSPRLVAINNQQAVLTFAENQVYFTLNVQQNSVAINSGSTNTITVNSTPHTVPIGIILALQPSINTETNDITLSVRPTLSRVTGEVIDPAVAFTLAQAAAEGIDTTGINSTLPIIEVRDLDSILKIKSGQVMVIGGLMETRGANTDTGVPYAQDMPFFGGAFKGTNRSDTVRELVIFLRATIVDSKGYAAEADEAIYKKFTNDPRPLNF